MRDELVEWVRALRTPDLRGGGESVSGKTSSNRFRWLSDEEDPRVGEVLREDFPAPSPSPASPLARTPSPAASRAKDYSARGWRAA